MTACEWAALECVRAGRFAKSAGIILRSHISMASCPAVTAHS